jgi:hypothetical protein
MDRPDTCIILDKKYNIANSSCHFGSYGSIWISPSPKKYYMDRSFWGPYNIFLVTDRSIYCHMTLSAMHYLLYNAFLMDAERLFCMGKWIKVDYSDQIRLQLVCGNLIGRVGSLLAKGHWPSWINPTSSSPFRLQRLRKNNKCNGNDEKVRLETTVRTQMRAASYAYVQDCKWPDSNSCWNTYHTK